MTTCNLKLQSRKNDLEQPSDKEFKGLLIMSINLREDMGKIEKKSKELSEMRKSIREKGSLAEENPN